ncbi:MAG: lytic transglycosylase domain-containing protein [Xanthomonadaceae bacterium]|nr:lytic transglycosylase domain-containing protein [Xanthomonadaceae bacterium]
MNRIGSLLVVGLSLLACAPASTAGDALYRCEGADGIRSYVGQPVAGQSCRRVAGATGGSAAAAGSVAFRSASVGQSLDAATPTAGSRVSRGAVYKYERDGVTHYTNVKPAGASGAKVLFTYIETCFACALRAPVDFSNVRLNTEAFGSEIRAAAVDNQVDEALLRAVIHAESAFNANARSHKGAQGLMQLMPATAERFGVGDPYQPEQNIKGGSAYLAWLLKRYKGDITLAAAAYNAGEGAVDRHGGVPPYEETQRYVERVNILAARYRGALTAGGSR